MWNWRAVALFQTKPGWVGGRSAGWVLREAAETAWRRVWGGATVPLRFHIKPLGLADLLAQASQRVV